MVTAGVRMARVLIGDFNAVLRLGLRELLLEAGCDVVADDGADELLDRINQSLPDVVLVDLIDVELARALSVAYPAIKVIACADSAKPMQIFPRFHHGESFLAPMSAESLADASSDA